MHRLIPRHNNSNLFQKGTSTKFIYLLLGRSRSQSNETISSQQQPCPFRILGLDRNNNPTNKDVKNAFLTLALKYHPDTNPNSTSVNNDFKPNDGISKDVRNNSKEQNALQKFIQIKSAFDQIQHFSRNNNNDDILSTNDNVDEWFYKETGVTLHPSSINVGELNLSSKMIKEMVDVTNKTGQSGLDKGGMWELARMLSKQVNNKEIVLNKEDDPLAIEAPKSKRRQRRRTR